MTDRAKDSGIIAKFADGADESQPVASSECNGAGFATSDEWWKAFCEADNLSWDAYAQYLYYRREAYKRHAGFEKALQREQAARPKSANDPSSATTDRP